MTKQRSKQKNWLILLAYFVLTAIFTWPTLLRLTTAVSGADAEDALQYTWSFWWAKEAMLTLQQLPSNLSVWGFPEGVYHPLLFVTPYLDFVTLPITLAWGPVAAYNSQLLLSFTLSAFTAYLLGYAVTRHRLAGFAAGVIFSFSAHRWGHAFAGHIPHLTIYWGPLFAWAMWRFVQRPDRKRGLWVGFTAGLTGLIHVMHAAYWLLPVASVFTLWGWRNYAKSVPNWWKKLITGGLWGLLPLAALVGPFYLIFFRSLQGAADNLKAAGIAGNALDLLAFLAPAPTNPALLSLGLMPALSTQILPRLDSLDEGVAYLSVAGIILSALGLMKWWGARTRLWLWLALVSGVLALGPLLKVGGELAIYDTGRQSSYIVLPYALLSRVPLLSWGRTTARLAQTLMLAMSILSAFGVLALAKYLKRPWQLGAVTAAFLALFLLESLVVFPMPQASPVVSPFYQQSAEEMAIPPGGVLDLPLKSRREVNTAMFYQMYHHRPIVGGFIHRRFESFKRSQRFANLLFTPPSDTNVFPLPADEERLSALRSMGVQTVILHKNLVSKDADREQLDYARALLGTPRYEDEQIAVFDTPPGELPSAPMTLPDPAGWKTTGDGVIPDPEVKWHLYTYAPAPARMTLNAILSPVGKASQLTAISDAAPAQRLLVTGRQSVSLPAFALDAGFSRMRLSGWEDCGEGEACPPLRFERLTLEPTTAGSELLAVWGDNAIGLVKIDTVADENTGQWFLHLYWLPLNPLPVEPTIFVHLLNQENNLVTQADHRLLDGAYPPEYWIAGALVQDIVPLPAEINLAAEPYTLRIGLYDVNTGERFPVSSASTDNLPWQDNLLLPIKDLLQTQ